MEKQEYCFINLITKWSGCFFDFSIFAILISPGGEIGRRTAFRWQHSQGCDGSSPFLGTLLNIKALIAIVIRAFISLEGTHRLVLIE